MRVLMASIGAFVLVGAAVLAGGAPTHAAPSSFTYLVDSAGTAGDSTLGDGACATAGGDCTLPAAIQQADFNCGSRPDDTTTTTIDISIGSGPVTILPGSFGLPPVKCPVVLDGTTQPGYAGRPIVQLNGTSTHPNNITGVSMLTSCTCPTVIRGFVINRFIGSGIGLGKGGPFTVENNFIGTNLAGTAALPNGSDGIDVGGGGSGVLVGGTTATARNVISGNGRFGVELQMSSSGNTVRGDFIGTDRTGSKPLGNGLDGVAVNGSYDILRDNVISANRSSGVSIFGAGVGHTVIQHNQIGTSATGATGLGNAADGISVGNTGPDTIGASTAANGNTIASNARDGVRVGNGTGHALLANAIFGNGTAGHRDSIGIDLTACGTCDGVTPNDAGDVDTGPNGYQNFPVLTKVTRTASATTVTGTLNSVAHQTYRVRFFSNAACDASGFGEAQTYIGAVNVSLVGTTASFTAQLPVVAHGRRLAATATAPDGSTSELSACRAVP
jgi:hypothetical protein